MESVTSQSSKPINVKSPKYDVILVDCETFKQRLVVRSLMSKPPMPNLTFYQASKAIQNTPFRVKQCVPINIAVAIEMALEIVGATVEIVPSRDC